MKALGQRRDLVTDHFPFTGICLSPNRGGGWVGRFSGFMAESDTQESCAPALSVQSRV